MRALIKLNPLIFIIVITLIVTKSVLTLDETFKINKLNLIWHKAQHSLGETKLKDLKKDLSKHEFDELTLKKMRAHNQDKDGLFEAAVRKKLLTIMSKYSLEKYYDDIHQPMEEVHERKQNNIKRVKEGDSKSTISNNPELKATFRDKRLDKLWKKAEQSSFNQEQLMVLYDEFQHQQDKLDEHYDTMNMIEQELELKAKEGDKWENSIGNTFERENTKRKLKEDMLLSKELPNDKNARLNSNVQQALNEKYSDIKKNIDKLHKKIIEGKVVENNEGPFEEEAVNNLWSAAIQANFTIDELESFKEELEHYETRIKKLKHFQVEFERNQIRGSKETNLQPEFDKETRHLRKRVKELSHKVDRTHKNLEDRIAKRREEL